jgi:hypothetical protein
MLKLILKTIFLAYATVLTTDALAEGGCPPGQVPQEGQGWKSCVPLGGGNNSTDSNTPTVTWEARWVALTADAQNGILGQSSDSRTEDEAMSTAMHDCTSQGGTNCKVVISAKNGCVAMATSTKVYGTGSGPNSAAADTSATKECQKGGDPNCNVIFNKCVSAKTL